MHNCKQQSVGRGSDAHTLACAKDGHPDDSVGPQSDGIGALVSTPISKLIALELNSEKRRLSNQRVGIMLVPPSCE